MSAPENLPVFSSVSTLVPEGLVWTYSLILRGGTAYHRWSLVGDRGGIHVDAWWSDSSSYRGSNWYGGIEAHSPIKQSEYGSDRPDHEHCWLIDGPCWHDGSSLQFSEEIAPMLPYADRQMGEYEHRAVLMTMISRYNSWLPTDEQLAGERTKEVTK